ncbi:MAG: hypothetical protein IMF12_02785 [Proteobacteria bacterium]|nr:hypothetical protein [Pseudomonadota bacterium]
MLVSNGRYEGERCSLPPGECPHQAENCIWCNSDGSEHDDSNTQWETSCGGSFILNEGTPESNDIKYCCYCGNSIEQLVES